MRTMLILLAIVTGATGTIVIADEPPWVPGGAEQQVIVNSQRSLSKIVGGRIPVNYCRSNTRATRS